MCLIAQDERRRGLDDLRKYVQLGPGWPAYMPMEAVYATCADCLSGDAAMRAAVMAQIHNPKSSRVAVTVSQVYCRQQKHYAAEQAARNAIENDSKNPRAYFALALATAGQGDEQLAMSLLRKGAALGERKIANQWLAVLSSADGRFDEALNYSQDSPKPFALAMQAFIRSVAPDARLRDGGEAVRAIKQLTDNQFLRMPGASRLLAGMAYAESGDFKTAIDQIQNALEQRDITESKRALAIELRALFEQGKPFRLKEDDHTTVYKLFVWE
jgi:Tfp pilus assembly protein PilF